MCSVFSRDCSVQRRHQKIVEEVRWGGRQWREVSGRDLDERLRAAGCRLHGGFQVGRHLALVYLCMRTQPSLHTTVSGCWSPHRAPSQRPLPRCWRTWSGVHARWHALWATWARVSWLVQQAAAGRQGVPAQVACVGQRCMPATDAATNLGPTSSPATSLCPCSHG